MIRLINVNKSYCEANQQRIIYQDVSLDINSGETVALIGRSGSGKSTLLNLISGIDLPDSGQICIFDEIINELTEERRTLLRRQSMGFVFQFFNLIPTLTVQENLYLPLELNNKLSAHYKTQARQWLSQVGLATRANQYPDKLSGGEQQRIAILRALVHEPMILLADEPTGNLDRETGRHVLELMQTLIQQQGKTLVLATHSMEVAQIADRVLTVHDGRLSAAQTTDIL